MKTSIPSAMFDGMERLARVISNRKLPIAITMVAIGITGFWLLLALVVPKHEEIHIIIGVTGMHWIWGLITAVLRPNLWWNAAFVALLILVCWAGTIGIVALKYDYSFQEMRPAIVGALVCTGISFAASDVINLISFIIHRRFFNSSKQKQSNEENL